METFNFDFKCKYCISYKNRRQEILNEVFDGNTTNNILSFTTCVFCHNMNEYEKEYKEKYDDTNKLILPNYKRVEHRQIHCILHHFSTGYNKLTNLKDTKNYLKDMIDKSTTGLKPLLKKFVNEARNIKMIDDYRMFWLLDYYIYYLHDEWGFYGETYSYRNKQEEPIFVIMIAIFFICFQKQVGLYRKYFNFEGIYDDLCDILKKTNHNINITKC